MRNVLFLNLTRHEKTAVVSSPDMYVKRVNSFISVNDHSQADDVWEVANQMVNNVKADIEEAIEKEHEILVALPGTSLLAATLAVGLWTLSNYRMGLVTATKTKEGFIFNLSAEKVIIFERLKEVANRLEG